MINAWLLIGAGLQHYAISHLLIMNPSDWRIFVIILRLRFIWKCSCGCFLKYFSFRNTSKWYFFIFLKLFLRSSHQNDPKHKKELIFSKNKLNFLKTRVGRRFQTLSEYKYKNLIKPFNVQNITLFFCYKKFHVHTKIPLSDSIYNQWIL